MLAILHDFTVLQMVHNIRIFRLNDCIFVGYLLFDAFNKPSDLSSILEVSVVNFYIFD